VTRVLLNLRAALTQVITTKAEHERALNMVESLLEKGERDMSREEDALLDLLTQADSGLRSYGISAA
jgi:hypothetical protein